MNSSLRRQILRLEAMQLTSIVDLLHRLPKARVGWVVRCRDRPPRVSGRRDYLYSAKGQSESGRFAHVDEWKK